MSPSKKDTSDYENRFFSLLQDTIEGIDNKVDKLSTDVRDVGEAERKTSTQVFRLSDRVEANRVRLDVLERAIPDKTVASVKELPHWWRDPSVIKLLSLVVGAIIVIVSLYAGLKGIKVPSP
jgi:hypothetical protein